MSELFGTRFCLMGFADGMLPIVIALLGICIIIVIYSCHSICYHFVLSHELRFSLKYPKLSILYSKWFFLYIPLETKYDILQHSEWISPIIMSKKNSYLEQGE